MQRGAGFARGGFCGNRAALRTVSQARSGWGAGREASVDQLPDPRIAGQLPAGVRFQVSLPTPWAVVMPFVQQPDARQVYPAYERAMLREVERILKAIPHHDLAIQWDVCLEMLAWDGRGRPARLFLEWSRSSPPTSRDSPPRCPVA